MPLYHVFFIPNWMLDWEAQYAGQPAPLTLDQRREIRGYAAHQQNYLRPGRVVAVVDWAVDLEIPPILEQVQEAAAMFRQMMWPGMPLDLRVHSQLACAWRLIRVSIYCGPYWTRFKGLMSALLEDLQSSLALTVQHEDQLRDMLQGPQLFWDRFPGVLEESYGMFPIGDWPMAWHLSREESLSISDDTLSMHSSLLTEWQSIGSSSGVSSDLSA
jgi:hypothetical protein